MATKKPTSSTILTISLRRGEFQDIAGYKMGFCEIDVNDYLQLKSLLALLQTPQYISF